MRSALSRVLWRHCIHQQQHCQKRYLVFSKNTSALLPPEFRRLYNKEGTELEQLLVLDTTLRDGEQSPGATLNVGEKLKIAEQLAHMGFDICEAGFPISSPGDFEAVQLIANKVGNEIENRRFLLISES